jgi:hypothetical protein
MPLTKEEQQLARDLDAALGLDGAGADLELMRTPQGAAGGEEQNTKERNPRRREAAEGSLVDPSVDDRGPGGAAAGSECR